MLTAEERAALDRGRWFARLPSLVRHDMLRAARVRRYEHGHLIVARGDPAEDFFACAAGAVRVGSTPRSGRDVTLAYLEPGSWFGDVGIFDGGTRTHDGHAHGPTTLLAIRRESLQAMLRQHPALAEALLLLQAKRLRKMFGLVEDLNTMPVRALLAKRLLHLMGAWGKPAWEGTNEIRIGLRLAQDELARLVGTSRQRLNLELKTLERQGAVRVVSDGVVVRDASALARITEAYSCG
jgi:CRP-like cAMP-binding protein